MSKQSERLVVCGTFGRHLVELEAIRLGNDLAVTIKGGDKPHIGAAAVAQPRPSLTGTGQASATASVITLCGHKDDELARAVALWLASQCGVVVSVVCGIHIDDASVEEIQGIGQLTQELAAKLPRLLIEQER